MLGDLNFYQLTKKTQLLNRLLKFGIMRKIKKGNNNLFAILRELQNVKTNLMVGLVNDKLWMQKVI